MFCDRNGDGVIKPENAPEASEVTQENSYYAFGMNMEFGAWENTPSVTDNLHQYNGKELNTDFGLNWNDYGRRMYDPTISRFVVMDRFAEKYKNLNPYNYADNNPICKYDFKGDSIIVLSSKQGAQGAGHAAVLIGSAKSGWTLYSKNGTYGSSGVSGASNKHPQNGISVGSLKNFDAKFNKDESGNKIYQEGVLMSSNAKTDDAMKKAASAEISKDYNLFTSSCVDVCSKALEAGGFDGGNTQCSVTNVPGDGPSYQTMEKVQADVPNVRYEAIKANNIVKTLIFKQDE